MNGQRRPGSRQAPLRRVVAAVMTAAAILVGRGRASRGAASGRRARSVGDAGSRAGVAARELADVGVADGVARSGAVRRSDVARRGEDGQQPSRRGRPELRRRRRDRRAAVGPRGRVGQHAVRGRPGRRLSDAHALAALAVVVVLVARRAAPATAAAARRPRPTSPERRPSPVERSATSDDAIGRRGAVAAALAYVASTDELMAHSPIGRREIFRQLVDRRLGRRHRSRRSSRRRRDLATTLDVPVERLVVGRGADSRRRSSTATATTASVDVWTVSILGAPDAGSPQQVWRTVHVDLELIDGRWLARRRGDCGRRADAGGERAGAAGGLGRLRASWPAGRRSSRESGCDRGADADVAVGSDRRRGDGAVQGGRGVGVGHGDRRHHRLAGEGLRAAGLVRVGGHGSLDVAAARLGVVRPLDRRAVPDGGRGGDRAAADLPVLRADPGRRSPVGRWSW